MSHPHTFRPDGRGRHSATTPSPLRHASNVSASSSEENSHESSHASSRASTLSSAASQDPFYSPVGQKRGIRETSPTKKTANPDYQYLSSDRSSPPSHRAERQSLKTLPQGANMMPPPTTQLLKPSHIRQKSQNNSVSSFDGALGTPDANGRREPQPKQHHSIGLSRSDSRCAPTRPRQNDGAISPQSNILDTADLEKLGRSTTGHLRTLSKLTAEGEDTDFKITSREQEVAGIQGRRRLQRNTSARGRKTAPGWGGRTWMDQQRQFLQAYEYLCHIGEAKEWIEDIIKKPIPPIVLLEEALRDGVTLAEVVQAIHSDRPLRIFQHPRLQFRHSDNIALFFKFLSEVELPELFRFELVDLYEKKNIPKVIYCIHALSWLLFRRGIVDFRIGNLVGQLRFEDHELEEVQKGLDRAGVSMPNFAGMSQELGAEPEPEPEETETDRVDRELGECQHAVLDFQTQIRGALLRLRLGDTMQHLWQDEQLLIELQARIRGDFARQIVEYRLQMKTFAMNLQSQTRGFLIRSREKGKERHWKDREKDVVILQSLARGRVARSQTQQQRTTLQRHQLGVQTVQAAIRGALRRGQHHDQRANARGAEVDVVRFQALARGHLARKNQRQDLALLRNTDMKVIQLQSLVRSKRVRDHRQAVSEQVQKHQSTWTSLASLARAHLIRQDVSRFRVSIMTEDKAVIKLQAAIRGQSARLECSETLDQLQQFEEPIRNLQSSIRAFGVRSSFNSNLLQLRSGGNAIKLLQAQGRGYLVRLRVYDQLCEMNNHEDAIATLQAIAKAMLLRMGIADDLERMEAEEGAIMEVQAFCRAMLVRARFVEKQRFYQENMKKVVKIQSFIRGRQQGEAYKSLTSGKNPPVGTVKNFVHLLNDSDFDFDEEVESEKLQKVLLQRVQANEQLEHWISDLDAKIGLLAQTKITSDEVAKMRKHYNNFSQGSIDRRSSLRDPFNPKTLNRGARVKIERYGELFYYLQTRPQYLARLFRKSREHNTLEPESKKLESLIMGAFSFAQKQREEYFLLKLMARSMKEEIDGCVDLQEFIRGSFFFARLFSAYTRVPRDRRYIKQVFGEVLTQNFVNTRNLDLENDPQQIYRALMNDEELRTGRPSERPPNLPRDQAIKDPEVRNIFVDHLQQTRHVLEDLLSHLEDMLQHMPYGTRFLVQQMFEMLQSRFPRDDERHLLAIVGHWLWKTYFRPAITEPESIGVIDTSLEPKQKKNLAEVGRLANQMALGRLFGAEDIFLQPLNSPLEVYIGRWQAFLCNIIDLPQIESKFNISELDDLYAKHKPTLYIKMHDVIALHEMTASGLAYVCVSQEDSVLREVLRDLGSPRSNEAELGAASGEVTLTLSGRVHSMQDPDADIKALFMETKRCVLYIIRVQAGSNLMDIMVKPITADDEARWENLVREELAASQRTTRKKTAYTDGPTSTNLVDIASMSYAELKAIALENILALERAERLTRHNQYQDLLNAIAVDIRNKHRRRVQRQQELERTRTNISHLEAKHTWLEERLKAYNDTFEQNLITLQGKAGKDKSKGKFVMPFSKQWHHNRDLERAGREPQYGSYKRSAEQFQIKGILLSWEGFDLRATDLTISSDEINQFSIEGSCGSMMVTGASAEFSWDDLLEAEYNGRDVYEFFTGMDGGSASAGRKGPGKGVLRVDRAAFKAWMSKKFFPDA